MPEKQTIKRAQRSQENHRAPRQASLSARKSITSGEGKHGERSTKQAIAIGLSKARRAGVNLALPRKTKVSESTRRNAERDYQAGRRRKSRPSPRRRVKRCKSRRAPLHDDGRKPLG